MRVHLGDVPEGIPQGNNHAEGKGLVAFDKRRILQDHCGSHTNEAWLLRGGEQLDLTLLSDLSKATD